MDEDVRRARRAWTFAGIVALAGLAWLSMRAGTLLRPRWPVFASAIGLTTLVWAGVLLPARLWGLLAPSIATLRLVLPLMFIATWQGDAREILGALVVWTAYKDGLAGRGGKRPLVPVAIALVAALGYSSEHADQIPGRMILPCALAAFAAAAGHRARRE